MEGTLTLRLVTATRTKFVYRGIVTRPDQIVRSTRVLHVKYTRYPRRIPILGVHTKFSSVTVIRHTAAKLASRSAVVR